MKMKKLLALLLALTLVVGMAACGNGNDDTKDKTDKGEKKEDGVHLSVNFASEPKTIDPTLNTSIDGAVMAVHTFEGLMKWVDDGEGNAILKEGQSTEHTKSEPDKDGKVVYTFKLRDDIKWSDGKDVTADDFVYAWQRLVDPKTAAEYNYMAGMVVNANEIMDKKKEPSELGIKAIDPKTVEITLTYDCPYFLELTAFPALMPLRKDVVEAGATTWTHEPDTFVTNGAMVMSEWAHNDYILMVPNDNYYARDTVTIDSLKFRLMDDFNSMLSGFRNGDLDFIKEVPVDEVQALKDSGELKVNPQLGNYYVCFNNDVKPFDDPRVREAFSLVIDRNYIVDQITRTGQLPADAFVPPGVADAEGPSGKEFHEVGGGYYSVSPEEYQANCDKARKLLAEAGYPDGKDFPIVEYLYNTNDNHKAIGEALQNMWQTELGVTVTLNNQDWAVFISSRTEGDYTIARHGWLADYNDPISFLDLFVTGGGNNDANYSNKDYDKAMEAAKATADPAERMKHMHEAEEILMKDMGIAPLYFYTQKYMLNEDVEGVYYSPLGYFFFMNATLKDA